MRNGIKKLAQKVTEIGFAALCLTEHPDAPILHAVTCGFQMDELEAEYDEHQ